MFFLHSGLTIGKKLINTAVSRAKKKLVIVCDYNYWIKQDKQLICKLLEVSSVKLDGSPSNNGDETHFKIKKREEM